MEMPSKFALNPHWQVVAGEENKEAEVQMQREMRVLEAIYPRPSATPSSPSISSELEELPCLEHQIPIVPLIPIEEEDVAHPSPDPQTTSTSSQLQTVPVSSSQGIPLKPQSNILTPPHPRNSNERSAGGVVPGVEPDVVAAASAAFTAIMKSSEQGSLIDRDLLIKILNNPELIGNPLTDYGMSTNSDFTSVQFCSNKLVRRTVRYTSRLCPQGRAYNTLFRTTYFWILSTCDQCNGTHFASATFCWNRQNSCIYYETTSSSFSKHTRLITSSIILLPVLSAFYHLSDRQSFPMIDHLSNCFSWKEAPHSSKYPKSPSSMLIEDSTTVFTVYKSPPTLSKSPSQVTRSVPVNQHS